MNLKPAGHAYTREELLSLKRVDIQRLCKDYGVRANMKTEALIELLLDSIHSNMSPLVPHPQPVRSFARRVSTRSSSRVSSLRARGTSGSSTATSHPTSDTSFPLDPALSRAHSSPRKSKDTQFRLGVGRPAVTGSPGVRRSLSIARSKRGRNSRSLRPPEETIDEEPDHESQSFVPDLPPAPTTSHEPWPSTSSTQSDDIASRLVRLESIFRDAELKQHFDSLKDLPGQVSWLKTSMQQCESEIAKLNNELHGYKTEIMSLRGEVAKIPLLEYQLRNMKQSLDQYGVSSSSTIAKGKMTRRVSIPLGESNLNSPDKTPSMPSAQASSQAVVPNRSPAATPVPGPSAITLGKRARDSNPSNMIDVVDARERNALAENDLARGGLRPDRKRTKIGGFGGFERRPLQEKEIVPAPDLDRPSSDQEASEEVAISSGTSSGPSSAPSVGTPPPMTHLPEYFGDSLDAAQHTTDQEDQTFDFSFHQVASSTPRDDMFNFFEAAFSPGSAMKTGMRVPSGNNHAGSSLQASLFEARRISSTVARPRTPTRSSGPERFRIDTTHDNSAQDDVASPFDPYDDDGFSIPFGNPTPVPSGDFAARGVSEHGGMPAPMPIPLAMGFGLGTVVPGMLPDDTPVRPAPRTMYGTEIQDDTRFGDFGRDGIATTSNMNFWGPF
ncbi:hypothetical protein DFH11DRAFT_1558337 [Phellopilus nigrolimitatus]|nr:hypothetical protein DFH11DRAFT_1558337 [Phellopilus nigrolimitatus]